MNKINYFDVLILGSGAAGLGLALSLAADLRIAVISKGDIHAGASPRAQGGIAAVMSNQDSYESHISDTLSAGVGLCHPEVVEFTIKNAKKAIAWLAAQGVQFTTTQNPSSYHLTQEGGHSQRRIVHAADKTGAVIINTLVQQISNHPNISYFTEKTAIDLIIVNAVCVGAIIFDNHSHTFHFIYAKVVILATGGASSCYLHTTNPDRTSGDGIAMAWRAGCRVANLEFNQFHPTCLYHPSEKSFLISEAVRGEGGILKLKDGTRFMQKYDSRAELAPRDIVTRAINAEMKKHNIPCVYLDISHRAAKEVQRLFPTIYAHCKALNIDLTQEAVPVVPAAHYTCGGVVTNLSGQTDIKQLYAVGEVAWTGLHGANRMASNSLLECLVFAASAANTIKQEINSYKINPIYPDYARKKTQKLPNQMSTELLQQLRNLMWDHVGIVRNNTGLNTALEKIITMRQEIVILTTEFEYTPDLIELNNTALICELITRCALSRKESRGLHFNADYPQQSAQSSDTVLVPTSELNATTEARH